MGRARIELAEPEGTRFTVWPATNYGIPTRIVFYYTYRAARCQYEYYSIAAQILLSTATPPLNLAGPNSFLINVSGPVY